MSDKYEPDNILNLRADSLNISCDFFYFDRYFTLLMGTLKIIKIIDYSSFLCLLHLSMIRK